MDFEIVGIDTNEQELRFLPVNEDEVRGVVKLGLERAAELPYLVIDFRKAGQNRLLLRRLEIE